MLSPPPPPPLFSHLPHSSISPSLLSFGRVVGASDIHLLAFLQSLSFLGSLLVEAVSHYPVCRPTITKGGGGRGIGGGREGIGSGLEDPDGTYGKGCGKGGLILSLKFVRICFGVYVLV